MATGAELCSWAAGALLGRVDGLEAKERKNQQHIMHLADLPKRLRRLEDQVNLLRLCMPATCANSGVLLQDNNVNACNAVSLR